MTKIKRNDPCPCGSGKKYKKCCLPKHKASPAPTSDEDLPNMTVIWDDDDADTLSNSVVDLIEQGKLDDAEALSKELLKRYPDLPDGLERMAMVHEARGDYALAADYYRKSADFVHGKNGYDPEMEEYFKQQAVSMKKKSGSE